MKSAKHVPFVGLIKVKSGTH